MPVVLPGALSTARQCHTAPRLIRTGPCSTLNTARRKQSRPTRKQTVTSPHAETVASHAETVASHAETVTFHAETAITGFAFKNTHAIRDSCSQHQSPSGFRLLMQSVTLGPTRSHHQSPLWVPVGAAVSGCIIRRRSKHRCAPNAHFRPMTLYVAFGTNTLRCPLHSAQALYVASTLHSAQALCVAQCIRHKHFTLHLRCIRHQHFTLHVAFGTNTLRCTLYSAPALYVATTLHSAPALYVAVTLHSAQDLYVARCLRHNHLNKKNTLPIPL